MQNIPAAPIKSSAPRTRPNGQFTKAGNGKVVWFHQYPQIVHYVQLAAFAPTVTAKAAYIGLIEEEVERVARQ